MKKILLFILLLFSIMSNGIAQNANYKTLASFNGDTLSYYKYNFIQSKDSFIGKKVSVLLNDLEIPVLSYDIGYDPKNPNNAKNFSFSNENDTETMTRLSVKNEKLYLLIVDFSPTISFMSLINYQKSHGFAITAD